MNMEEDQAISNSLNPTSDEHEDDSIKLRKRRDARRKRILENAKDRLQRLNNRNFEGTLNSTNESDLLHYPDPEVTPNSPAPKENNLLEGSDAPSSIKKKPKSVFLKAKIHILLTILVCYICSLVWNQTNFALSACIPVSLCSILDRTFFSDGMPINIESYGLPLLTLCGIRLNNSPIWKSLLNTLSTIIFILSDLSMTLFFYTVYTLFLTCFTAKYKDLALTN